VTHQTTVILHVDELGHSMTRMREWLCDNRYEADVFFLYQVEGDRVTVHVFANSGDVCLAQPGR
jgi:hypothetical protein